MLARKLQAAVGNAGGEALYVEDVFSTYLYTGTGSNNTITNGIDFSGEGGLLWIKNRTASSTAYPAANNVLIDTERGGGKLFYSNVGGSELDFTGTYGVTFNSNGFTLLSEYTGYNTSGESIVSWSFRKTSKFFDVVTYTGNGTAGRTVAHNLGSVPGCIIVKSTGANNWQVYHSGLTSSAYNLVLNDTSAQSSTVNAWNSTSPTSTEFTVGSSGNVNNSGVTYVAYLFAHDAGGFGEDGSESIIKCGSYTGNGSSSGPEITLNWEPQYVLIKRADSSGEWWINDIMRDLAVPGSKSFPLFANRTYDQATISGSNGAVWLGVTSTGFKLSSSYSDINATGGTYIYIAIRRGPMKTPTAGTEVFAPVIMTGTGSSRSITSGFPVDTIWNKTTGSAGLVGYTWGFVDRLRGKKALEPSLISGEVTSSDVTYDVTEWGNTSLTYGIPSATNINYSSDIQINWLFRRAPGFFDVVCYEGDSTNNRVIKHNLGVAPELLITMKRQGGNNWEVYHPSLGAYASNASRTLRLNLSTGTSDSGEYKTDSLSATQYLVSNDIPVNGSSYTYVAWLFATLAGVSKVGNYTGTGTTLNIDCGFSAGARFIVIKRSDSSGDWYVWDSTRGIVAGNDPYLFLNSSAIQNSSTDYIDPYSAGFTITSTAPAALNASGGTYIYLAIA